jgi:MFS family permease
LSPLLLVVSADLNVSLGTLSQIAAIGLFMYGGGAVLGGAISDRLGEEKAITLSMGLSGLSTLLMFFLPGVYSIGVGLFFIATWSSVYHPTVNSFITKVYERDMAQALSWHGVGGTLGTMAAPIISTVVGLTLGWRYPYLLFGCLAMTVGLFFYKYRSTQYKPQSYKKETSYKDIFRIKVLQPLFLFSVANGLILKGVEFFFPTVLVFKGFQIDAAGFALSGVLVCGVMGQIIGARVANKRGMRNVIIMACTISLAGLLTFQVLPEPFGAISFILLYGLTFYATIPAFNVLVARASPEDKRGTIYGFFFLLSFGLGSVSTSIGGLIIDRLGPGYILPMMIVFAVATLLSALKIKEDKPKELR